MTSPGVLFRHKIHLSYRVNVKVPFIGLSACEFQLWATLGVFSPSAWFSVGAVRGTKTIVFVSIAYGTPVRARYKGSHTTRLFDGLLKTPA